MAPAHAKSNLKEGLIGQPVPPKFVIARSVATKQSSLLAPVDCFASLAMTLGLRTAKRTPTGQSIGVARGDLAGDFGAFREVAADGEIGRRRTGAVALLKRPVAAIEAGDHLIAALAGRRFGVDERLRLVAPLLPFIRAANAAQEMQRTENLGEPLQIAVVGRGRVLRRRLRLRLRLSGRLYRLGQRLRLPLERLLSILWLGLLLLFPENRLARAPRRPSGTDKKKP